MVPAAPVPQVCPPARAPRTRAGRVLEASAVLVVWVVALLALPGALAAVTAPSMILQSGRFPVPKVAPTVVATAQHNGALATTWTSTLTGAPAANDVILIALKYTTGSASTATVGGNYSTAVVLSGPDTTSTTNQRSYLWRKVCAGTEGTTVSGTISNSASYEIEAVLVRGANPTTPEDVAIVTTVAQAGSTSHIAPAVTTVTDHALVFHWAFGSSTAATYTWPGGVTEILDGGNSQVISVASEPGPTTFGGGAVPARTATCSGNTQWTTYTLAIRPA